MISIGIHPKKVCFSSLYHYEDSTVPPNTIGPKDYRPSASQSLSSSITILSEDALVNLAIQKGYANYLLIDSTLAEAILAL